jgi:cell division protein FtsQ
MPKKTKEGNIDLFYMNNTDSGADKKNAPRKNKKTAKKVNKKSNQVKDDVFNFDDEMVIGISNNEPQTKKKVNSNANPKRKKRKKKKTFTLFLVKWTSIIVLLVGTIIFILTTPMFNIKQININGVEQLTEEQVLSLSGLNINENIFKNSKSTIIKNIKQNPYIEDVAVSRKLPDTLEITIQERPKAFMLQFVNGYVYINTQGYILEISDKKLDLPIITEYKTEEDKIVEGNRLINEDLENLNNVLKITEALEEIEIPKNKITSIDISDKEDYTVYIEEEKKTIHFGDISNLNSKILYVKAMIDQEKGNEGEIFVNGDLNGKFKPFFREKV